MFIEFHFNYSDFEIAAVMTDATKAATASETGGVAVSEGFGGLLAKALPEGK